MISDKQMEELKQLKELLDADILSKEEFEEKKAKIFDVKEETAEPEKHDTANDLTSAPVKEESVKPVVGPEEVIPASNTEEAHVTEPDDSKKDNEPSIEPVKMTVPDYGSATGSTPVKKKSPIKIIIIAVIAAIVVLGLLMAVIGGSGSKDSGYEDTGSDASEYSSEEEPEEEEAVLVSISADYSGDTEKGTKLNEDNDGITVTGSYDDGTTETLYGWTVEKPKTLKAGKTAKITINYEDQSCDLEVKCTTVSKKQFKKSCKTIAYDKLARNPGKYEGKNIKIYGQIIQVVEDGSDTVTFRVGTKNSGYGSYYDDVFIVTYTYDDDESRMLEDDMVTMWGSYGGTYTYESTGSGDITVPLLYAEYAERN